MNDLLTNSVRILIFAKAPEAGMAKTRLIPALGAQGAAELARQMLYSTLDAAIAANLGSVELCVTPAIDDRGWQDAPLPAGIEISAQEEGDLGARMARAAERGLANAPSVLLIGTDCVEMSAALLREAAKALQERDAVIHCTADGGDALLGLKRFDPSLFNDIAWSKNTVAGTTIERITRLGWSYQVGAELHDVDEPQDLTAAVCRKWSAKLTAEFAAYRETYF